MIGFRVRFKIPPDQPGDPKIFLPRIVFLIPGFLLLCFGGWEAWQYFRLPPPTAGQPPEMSLSLDLMRMNLEPRSVAGVCAIVFLLTGALFLWLGLLAERGLRKGLQEPHEDDRAFVSARKFTLVASLVGYLYFFGFVLSPWLLRTLPGMLVGLLWVSTSGALCAGILWCFQKRGSTGRNGNEQRR